MVNPKEADSLLHFIIKSRLTNSSRVNTRKKYWYPLSMANYGTEEIMEALDSLLNFQTTMWDKTRLFEKQFAEWQGCVEAVMVNSGSSANLLMAFELAEREPWAEILCPVVTWPTHIWAPMMAGLKVRLVDVSPRTFNMDIDDAKRKIGVHTRAIWPVHLLGNPVDMRQILDLAWVHDLIVLEDCCEALGSTLAYRRVGNFGTMSSFSFFFSHHMTTMEGGMIVCNDGDLADRLRLLRAHGWTRALSKEEHGYTFENWGFNVRPTELQAGFGIHQLAKLDQTNAVRRQLAEDFFSYVDSTEWLTRPRVIEAAEPCWFALPVMVREGAPFSKAALIERLERLGVETRPIVAGNLARQPAARRFSAFERDGPYPGADEVHERGFYVGLLPGLGKEGIVRLIDSFEEASCG